jgi:hypothetical protein
MFIVPSNFTLSVISAGNGSGTVTSNPAGVNCPASCSASFPTGSTVTLTASPDSGYIFSGWSGVCSGTSACGITMNGAEFVRVTRQIKVREIEQVVKPGAGLHRGSHITSHLCWLTPDDYETHGKCRCKRQSWRSRLDMANELLCSKSEQRCGKHFWAIPPPPGSARRQHLHSRKIVK